MKIGASARPCPRTYAGPWRILRSGIAFARPVTCHRRLSMRPGAALIFIQRILFRIPMDMAGTLIVGASMPCLPCPLNLLALRCCKGRVSQVHPIWTCAGTCLFIAGESRHSHLEASFLVDATGRAGWLTRALGRKRILYDTMLALVGVLTAQTSASLVDPVLCLEATEDGWWYSAPVPDGSLVVVYMTDRDYLTGRDQPPMLFWRNQLERTMHTLVRSQGFHLGDEGKVHVKSTSTYILERPAGEGWLAVGDAACTYDPLSGEGITKALASALRAAETIHATLQDDARAMDKYVVELARKFDGYLMQRARYYHQETRWSTSSFWLRRQVARLATEL